MGKSPLTVDVMQRSLSASDLPNNRLLSVPSARPDPAAAVSDAAGNLSLVRATLWHAYLACTRQDEATPGTAYLAQ